jgi:hypothetical protein
MFVPRISFVLASELLMWLFVCLCLFCWLQASYVSEGMIAKHGGDALMSNVEPEKMNSVADVVRASTTENFSGPPGIKDLTTQAAHIAATVASQEQQSRALELELIDAQYLASADKVFRKNYKASHPDRNLDVHFLDVHHLTWKPQIYPPISGHKPSSRVHFGAMVLGEYCFVVGGAEPTALHNITADGGSSGDKSYIRIYALHLPTMVWGNPIPIENTESLEVPLQIAESDIIRARAQVEEERDRAKILRARRGMTVELAEAEAVLQVCEWRKGMLLKEQRELIPSPQNCFGVTFERIGRLSGVYYFVCLWFCGGLTSIVCALDRCRTTRVLDGWLGQPHRDRDAEAVDAGPGNGAREAAPHER